MKKYALQENINLVRWVLTRVERAVRKIFRQKTTWKEWFMLMNANNIKGNEN